MMQFLEEKNEGKNITIFNDTNEQSISNGER